MPTSLPRGDHWSADRIPLVTFITTVLVCLIPKYGKCNVITNNPLSSKFFDSLKIDAEFSQLVTTLEDYLGLGSGRGGGG